MKRDKSTPSIPSLTQIAPFDRLDEGRLNQMVAASRLVRAERGEILIQADEISSCVHVVLDGEVKSLLLAPSGNEKLIRIVGPGEVFGEESLHGFRDIHDEAGGIVGSGGAAGPGLDRRQAGAAGRSRQTCAGRGPNHVRWRANHG